MSVIVSKETAFCFDLLRGHTSETNEINWNDVLKWLCKQKMSVSFIDKAIENAPMSVHNKWRIVKKKRVDSAIILGKALAEIMKDSEIRRLKGSVIKGLPLSAFLYNDPLERFVGDIDILTTEDNLVLFDRVLRKNGFKQFVNTDSISYELPFPLLKTRDHHELFGYKKLYCNTKIEVEVCRWFHVNITNYTTEFLRFTTQYSFYGTNIPCLDEQHMFLNLIENTFHDSFGIRSNFFGGITLLRDYEDLHAFFIRNPLILREIEPLIHKYDMKKYVNQVMTVYRDLFYTPFVKKDADFIFTANRCTESVVQKIEKFKLFSDPYRQNYFRSLENNCIVNSAATIQHGGHVVSLSKKMVLSFSVNMLKNEELRIKCKIIQDAFNLCMIYVWYKDGKLCYQYSSGKGHFFDDYYDLSDTQETATEVVPHEGSFISLPLFYHEDGSGKKHYLAQVSLQERKYRTVYYTVGETSDYFQTLPHAALLLQLM